MPPDPLDLWLTLAALAVGLGLMALMAWLERRPRRDLNPRLVPTTPVLFVGTAIALLALVHLLNLWGIHTGRQ
ncbi:MAG: hypothetical protein HY245_08505 [Rhizobiales bacterium]|nr:hypothetical protein [Hyphomicrobiales bacterium]MBI3673444.1 hypothetical protein [Hyphomicrobiales bacterium]